MVSLDSKLCAKAGILASAVMFVVYFICLAVNASHWSIHNSISDFGYTEESSTVVLFIGACVVSGLLLILSGYGRFLYGGTKYIRFGGLFVSFSGLGLILVGVVSKTFNDTFHQICTMLFIILFVVAILLTCIQDLMDGDRRFSIGFGILAIFAGFAIIVGYIPYFVLESVLMGYVFFWYICKCFAVLKETPSDA